MQKKSQRPYITFLMFFAAILLKMALFPNSVKAEVLLTDDTTLYSMNNGTPSYCVNKDFECSGYKITRVEIDYKYATIYTSATTVTVTNSTAKTFNANALGTNGTPTGTWKFTVSGSPSVVNVKVYTGISTSSDSQVAASHIGPIRVYGRPVNEYSVKEKNEFTENELNQLESLTFKTYKNYAAYGEGGYVNITEPLKIKLTYNYADGSSTSDDISFNIPITGYWPSERHWAYLTNQSNSTYNSTLADVSLNGSVYFINRDRTKQLNNAILTVVHPAKFTGGTYNDDSSLFYTANALQKPYLTSNLDIKPA